MLSRVVRLGLRFGLALLFLAKGSAKLMDIDAFATVLRYYNFFLEPLMTPLALAIIISQLLVGVWLLTGLGLLEAAWTTFMIFQAYAVWAAVAILRGLKLSNTGAFGNFWARPLSWMSVAEYLLLALLAGWLYLITRKRGR